jgi:hypothetical protein
MPADSAVRERFSTNFCVNAGLNLAAAGCDKAVHKTRGLWIVGGADGEEIDDGLSGVREAGASLTRLPALVGVVTY